MHTATDTTQGLRVSPIQDLKNRVSEIRDDLPVSYRKIIYQHYAKYNTKAGRRLIANVVDLRSTDVALTEILEKIHRKELRLIKISNGD